MTNNISAYKEASKHFRQSRISALDLAVLDEDGGVIVGLDSRLAQFHAWCEDHRINPVIQTEQCVLFETSFVVAVKATAVIKLGDEMFSASGMASAQKDNMQDLNMVLQTAENSALSRALRFAGFGICPYEAGKQPEDVPETQADSSQTGETVPESPEAPKEKPDEVHTEKAVRKAAESATKRPVTETPPKKEAPEDIPKAPVAASDYSKITFTYAGKDQPISSVAANVPFLKTISKRGNAEQQKAANELLAVHSGDPNALPEAIACVKAAKEA